MYQYDDPRKSPALLLAQWFICDHLKRPWCDLTCKRQVALAEHLLRSYTAEQVKHAVLSLSSGKLKSTGYERYPIYSLAALLEPGFRHPHGLSPIDEDIAAEAVRRYRNRPAVKLARSHRESYLQP